MRRPLSDYSGDERKRIAALAKRNLKAEVRLILGGGFAFLMIVLFLFAERTFLPLSFAIGVRPTVVWAGMAFSAAALWAYLHHRRTAPKIAAAKTLDAAFLHDYQVQVQRENRARSRSGQ